MSIVWLDEPPYVTTNTCPDCFGDCPECTRCDCCCLCEACYDAREEW